MSKTFPLTKPVVAHGKEITEVTLRDLGNADVIDLGLPTLIIARGDGEHGIEIRQGVIARYIARLAGIPLPSVRELSLHDASLMQAHIMSFFETDAASDGQMPPAVAAVHGAESGGNHGE